MIKILFGIFITLVLTINIHAAMSQTQVSSCGTLNQADSVYTLTTNVSSAGTCFTIGANNITLEGKGYVVNYSMTRAGYGIVDTAGYDNIIIQNLTLTQKNASVTNSHGIYFKNVANSKVENISVTTQGSSSDGVYLNSSGSSTFSNFNIITSNISAYGVYMYLSNSNSVVS